MGKYNRAGTAGTTGRKVEQDALLPSTRRAAKLVSLLLNPLVLCPPCFFAVACEAAPRWPQRLRWWALSCSLITLAPLVHIRWGLRTGRFSNADISIRQERLVPYVAQIGTLCLTYGLLRWSRAPRLVVVVISVTGALVVVTLATTLWKVSAHVMGVAGTTTVLVLLHGRRALPLVGLVPLVAWSRYVLRQHTPLQALAGAVLGAAAPIIVFHKMNMLHQPTSPLS